MHWKKGRGAEIGTGQGNATLVCGGEESGGGKKGAHRGRIVAERLRTEGGGGQIVKQIHHRKRGVVKEERSSWGKGRQPFFGAPQAHPGRAVIQPLRELS